MCTIIKNLLYLIICSCLMIFILNNQIHPLYVLRFLKNICWLNFYIEVNLWITYSHFVYINLLKCFYPILKVFQSIYLKIKFLLSIQVFGDKLLPNLFNKYLVTEWSIGSQVIVLNNSLRMFLLIHWYLLLRYVIIYV